MCQILSFIYQELLVGPLYSPEYRWVGLEEVQELHEHPGKIDPPRIVQSCQIGFVEFGKPERRTTKRLIRCFAWLHKIGSKAVDFF